MGTKVQYKSCFGRYNPMRDLNDDLNGNSCPLFCGEKSIPNYTGFIPRAAADVYPCYDKNTLKQKMIEHDSIFKNQVHELHRLYRIQRDMMEEIKTNEHCRNRGSIEPSSSSIQGSRVPADDVPKWHHRSYPLGDSCYPRSTESGSENVNSPLSYTKGKSTLASQDASRNGFPKEFDVSEARPSKVRKKLFDLQLPADEYVDTEDDEKVDNIVSANPRFTPSEECCKTATESRMKLTVGDVKMCGLQGGFNSASHFRSSTGLADLNEPIGTDEVTESSTANIFGHSDCIGGAKDVYLPTKPNPRFLGLREEVMPKSFHGSHMSSLNSMYTENKINGRDWFSYPYEADHSKEDLRKERLSQGWAAPHHRSLEYSNHNHMEPAMACQVSNQFPFMNSSTDATTWPQMMRSLGKPTDSLKPKLTSFHNHPSSGSSPSLNRVLQSSDPSNHMSGNRWQVNCSFRSNPSLASDLPSHNGFYQGSSSGSKDLPVCFSSIGVNHLNSNKSDNTSYVRMINGMEKAFTSSGFVDIKPPIDMNLNETFPKNALEEPVILRDLDSADRNCKAEVHQIALPWLREKPPFYNEATNLRREVIFIDDSPPSASPSLFTGKSKAVIDLNQVYKDTSTSKDHMRSNNDMNGRSNNETNGIPIVQKILGVPMFEKLGASEDRVSALASSTTEGENGKHERKHRLIDINVACDASLESEDELEMDEVVGENKVDKSSCSKNFIDLNTWVAEDEDPPVPTVARITGPKKAVVEIDLEAPAITEEEDDFWPKRDKVHEKHITRHPPDNDTKKAEDEAMMIAAEAIVNISSCQHINQETDICSPSDTTAEGELLQWFANIVSTSPISEKEGSYKMMDDFEAMTLQLAATEKEDFMPKPFVPEVQNVEETGTNALPVRPRRGQARRGRQRRDFQRDILPGLVSLSRHELTEDLQTFGGLMRAMGHSWNSGLTRRSGGRNGSGRGRRRTVVEAAPAAPPPVAAFTQPVQQSDNGETSLEDRSLTSWGKKTRRPRRQRCPVGNAPTVALT